MRTIRTVLGIILVVGCLVLPARSQQAQVQGIPNDWSHHHLIFSKPSSPAALQKLQREPRYQMQQTWRGRQVMLGYSAGAFDARAMEMIRSWGHPAQTNKAALTRDWSQSLGGATVTVGNEMYPAKFSFNTGTANCASTTNPDYVAFNTSQDGSGSQASIIAFDNLYGGGLCTGTVPTVYWSYNLEFASCFEVLRQRLPSRGSVAS